MKELAHLMIDDLKILTSQIDLTLPNILTLTRIIFSFSLLFDVPFSILFYIVYSICGVTDVLDGYFARKLNVSSEIGGTLDSISDFVFVFICVIILAPAVRFSNLAWIWISVIALFRIFNIITGYIHCNRLVMLHTKANKYAGLFIFFIPYFINRVRADYLIIPACIIASYATLQEFILIRRNRTGAGIDA